MGDSRTRPQPYTINSHLFLDLDEFRFSWGRIVYLLSNPGLLLVSMLKSYTVEPVPKTSHGLVYRNMVFEGLFPTLPYQKDAYPPEFGNDLHICVRFVSISVGIQ